ncbi:MAG: glycoside hydrolase [Chloroflexi bacterium]|nr:glycoside hydrolase [Chloroflexota bacterium]
MPLEKNYQSNDTVCKVTFVLPKDTDAHEIFVVGEWDGWDPRATPMSQLKSGEWKARVKLDANDTYQYRYLVDGVTWMSDPDPDDSAPNVFGERNSIVNT